MSLYPSSVEGTALDALVLGWLQHSTRVAPETRSRLLNRTLKSLELKHDVFSPLVVHDECRRALRHGPSKVLQETERLTELCKELQRSCTSAPTLSPDDVVPSTFSRSVSHTQARSVSTSSPLPQDATERGMSQLSLLQRSATTSTIREAS